MTIPWQPGYQGAMVVPATYTDPHVYSAASWQLLAGTGPAGYTLVNGTGTILTWAVPADNLIHSLLLTAFIHVTSNQTGGAITLNTTVPDGTASNPGIFAGGIAAGLQSQLFNRIVQAGSVVTLTQSSAQTLGAAVMWAQLWGA